MKMNKPKNKKVGYVWRCTKEGINKLVIKINIRVNSIFNSMKADLRILYFNIFYNFIDIKSINQIFINCKEFYSQLHIDTISEKNIIKLCNILRMKIMHVMYYKWNHNIMGRYIN